MDQGKMQTKLKRLWARAQIGTLTSRTTPEKGVGIEAIEEEAGQEAQGGEMTKREEEVKVLHLSEGMTKAKVQKLVQAQKILTQASQIKLKPIVINYV